MATKPMHEYYASYDLYAMIQSRQRCVKLKEAYSECCKIFPNRELQPDYCLEKMRAWRAACNVQEKDNIK